MKIKHVVFDRFQRKSIGVSAESGWITILFQRIYLNKKLNVRFSFRFLAVLSIVCVLIWGVHMLQASRMVDAFLREADVARDQGRVEDESNYLQRYLSLRSDNNDARERLARLLAKTARTVKERIDAILLMSEVLRRDPDRDQFRREVAAYSMSPELGLFRDARRHLEILVEKSPPDVASLEYLCTAVTRRNSNTQTRWCGMPMPLSISLTSWMPIVDGQCC